MEIAQSTRTALPGFRADAGIVPASTGSARTELPPEQAVAPTVPAMPSGAELPKEAAAGPDLLDRKIEVDAETQVMVFRAINQSTGEIVRQVPDQALLRLHAYAQELRHDVMRAEPDAPALEITA